MNNDRLFYFAYGSNLHPVRLAERIPSSIPLGVTHLPGHCLKFHKRGADNSGKCNALYTGQSTHQVPGVVYRMATSEKPLLDAIEGNGYIAKTFSLELSGVRHKVFAYIAESHFIDENLLPYSWYRSLVAIGARYHNFPETYVREIEDVMVTPDPDKERQGTHEQLLVRMRRP